MTWILAAAALVGALMAALRFIRDRPPPALASKLHGYLASAGIALLAYGWAAMPMPKIVVIATVLLLLASAGGVTLGQAWRWKRAPSAEVLIFGHLSLAATGYLILLVASLSAI